MISIKLSTICLLLCINRNYNVDLHVVLISIHNYLKQHNIMIMWDAMQMYHAIVPMSILFNN